MSQINENSDIQEKEKQDTLRRLSQSVKNITEIIDAHVIEPIGEDKEMTNSYYFPERENLRKLLKNNYVGLSLNIDTKKLSKSLPYNLLLNKAQTEKAKMQLDQARDVLSDALGKIQINRKYNNTKPTTGLESGRLKVFLDEFIAKKEKMRTSIFGKKEIIYKKSKKTELSIPELPEDLNWEEITIRFLNGDEVQITAKELVRQTNYELMGFQDQKTKNPNLQWEFLKVLSLKNGYLHWDNNNELDTKTINRVKQQKKALSDKLKIYFHTVKDDPFLKYKEEKGYKIKILLIPEQGSDIEDTKKIISSNIDSYHENVNPDVQDYFNKQMINSDNW
jgi:hypothetical protein